MEPGTDVNDVGSRSAPELVDLDGDGRLDLLIGNLTGTCTAYRNTGADAPAWSRATTWDIPDQSAYAVPEAEDLDGDGDQDVLLGDRHDDTCRAWENTGDPSSPEWTRNTAWDVSIAGPFTSPALGDLDPGATIFADGFETGDTSAWSGVEQKLTAITWGGGNGVTAREPTAAARSRASGIRPVRSNSHETGFVQSVERADTYLSTPDAQEKMTYDQLGYTFNAADNLTQVTGQAGVLEDYTYDGDGLRIKKITAGGDTVVYIRDPAGNVLAEYDAGNNLLAEYVYANGHQVSKVEPNGGGDSFRFFHSDHLGTALVITDESGALTWRGEYFPFGEEYSSQGTPSRYRFVERELDQTTGLSYMRARYYNPHLGRFLSVDPVGGDVANSQSWNRYAYVLNNPVALYDPDGEAPHIAIGALAGGIVSGGIEAIRQYRAGDDWNVAKIGTAAGQGMAVGAVAAATGGTSLLVAGAGVGTTTAVTGVAGRALDMDSQTGALDVSEVSADFAGGAVGGAVGFKVGQAVTRNITTSQTQRTLAKQANRWVRRVQNRSPSRQANALANADSVASRPADWGRRAAGAARGGTAAATSMGVRQGVQAIQNTVSSHRKNTIPMVSSH